MSGLESLSRYNRHVHRADYLRQVPSAIRFISAEPLLSALPDLDLEGIDWVIAGGESGPKDRPPRPEWFRDLRDQCLETDVAFFFKQWGGRYPKARGRELEGRTWNQYPALPELRPKGAPRAQRTRLAASA